MNQTTNNNTSSSNSADTDNNANTSNNNSSNNNSNPYRYVKKKESPEVLAKRVEIYTYLSKLAVIYAIISTFCLYRNLSGVTMPVFGIATLVYLFATHSYFEIKIKPVSYFYGAMMLLLCVSDFLTANTFYICFNNIGIIALIFAFIFTNFYDLKKWSFMQTIWHYFNNIFSALDGASELSKDKKAVKQAAKDEIKVNGNVVNPETLRKRYVIKSVITGILICIPIIIVVLYLLSKADVVFETFVKKYLLFDIGYIFRNFISIAITFYLINLFAYCTIRNFSRKKEQKIIENEKKFEPIIGITTLSIIALIYLIFSAIQIMYLFIGKFSLPNGYTYSHYAREGFIQLLIVCIINIMLVLFFNNKFEDNGILNFLMTLISLCTYIMIASSFMRMSLYIKLFKLTHLRILTLWMLIVLSLLFIGVIISIYKDDFPLFSYGALIISIMYIILSFSHTDYLIAKYNLKELSKAEAKYDEDYDFSNTDYFDYNDYYFNNFEAEYSDVKLADYHYLTTLSADAAPIIAKYSDAYWAENYFNKFKYDTDFETDNFRHFNLSRYTERKVNPY